MNVPITTVRSRVQIPSRSRLQWKPDPRGYFTRQIGWKISRSGKTQQHKFILGTDRREAEARERKLRELWDQFEKTSSIPAASMG